MKGVWFLLERDVPWPDTGLEPWRPRSSWPWWFLWVSPWDGPTARWVSAHCRSHGLPDRNERPSRRPRPERTETAKLQSSGLVTSARSLRERLPKTRRKRKNGLPGDRKLRYFYSTFTLHKIFNFFCNLDRESFFIEIIHRSENNFHLELFQHNVELEILSPKTDFFSRLPVLSNHHVTRGFTETKEQALKPFGSLTPSQTFGGGKKENRRSPFVSFPGPPSKLPISLIVDGTYNSQHRHPVSQVLVDSRFRWDESHWQLQYRQ